MNKIKILFLSIFFLGLHLAADAQNPFKEDSLLAKLQSELPDGYNLLFDVDNEELILVGKDSFYIHFVNMAGIRPDQMNEFSDSTILKRGQKIVGLKLFKTTPRWTPEKMKEVRTHNTELYNKIEGLLKKHDLENVKQWNKWGETGFTTHSPEEEKRVKAYEKERENLYKEMQSIPGYHTSKYSLFYYACSWNNNAPNMVGAVYPEEQRDAIRKIEILFQQLQQF